MGQRGVLGILDDVGKVQGQENMAHLRNVGDCVVVGAELFPIMVEGVPFP